MKHLYRVGELVVDDFGISKVIDVDENGTATAQHIMTKEMIVEMFNKFLDEDVLQKFLNSRNMSIVANEYLIDLHKKQLQQNKAVHEELNIENKGELPCDNCIHRAVCGKYKAPDHIGPCHDFDIDRPQRGEWLVVGHDDTTYWYRCSNCEYEEHDNFTKHYRFCPHCGADMRGRSEHDKS